MGKEVTAIFQFMDKRNWLVRKYYLFLIAFNKQKLPIGLEYTTKNSRDFALLDRLISKEMITTFL